jgi:hypothetical protein
MSLGLRDELLGLKTKLEDLEAELTNQMLELEVKAEEWHKRDEEVEETIKKNKNQVITLNVGGKKFQTKLETLLSMKDTLFSKIFLSGRLDLNKEIFIDRSYFLFHYILSYLRNKKLISTALNNQQIDELMEEASFYEIQELIDILEEMKREIKYVKFESSGTYVSGTITAGTNNIEDLNNFEDRSMMKGICCSYGGWIILELIREAEFEEFEVGGWGGNPNIWGPSNGASATVLTSIDKATWITVGSLPSNYGAMIQNVKVTRSKAKWIKFQCSSYLGIGYFKIKRS